MGGFCAIWTVRSAHKIVCKTLLVIMFVIARGARQILRYAQVGIFFLRPPVTGFRSSQQAVPNWLGNVISITRLSSRISEVILKVKYW